VIGPDGFCHARRWARQMCSFSPLHVALSDLGIRGRGVGTRASGFCIGSIDSRASERKKRSSSLFLAFFNEMAT
jgi:hypothetical protein